MCCAYFGVVRSGRRKTDRFSAGLYIPFNPDGQLHFFTLPELNVLAIPPIRNAQAVTVDQQALSRPSLHAPLHTIEPVDFCVIKKTGLGLFSLREKLVVHKVIRNSTLTERVFNTLDRIFRWSVVDPVRVERGPCFASPTKRISISWISGGELYCP